VVSEGSALAFQPGAGSLRSDRRSENKDPGLVVRQILNPSVIRVVAVCHSRDLETSFGVALVSGDSARETVAGGFRAISGRRREEVAGEVASGDLPGFAGAALFAIGTVFGGFAGGGFGCDQSFFRIIADVANGLAWRLVVWGFSYQGCGDLESIEKGGGLGPIQTIVSQLPDDLGEGGHHTGSVLDGRQRECVGGGKGHAREPAGRHVVIAEGLALESGCPALMAAG